ncbi:hypothetical protein Klosneuvirus_3_47 [Klosneuvirus KNV1]|uniref:Uncharacterized protein n=1 Tax=Klosneuvirus KNV1 TaxID=1977640 RepID=A0A1V0SJK6_9VIRU|nr:hypothetical protein Klosneuvirus_3_47 [Klosneuvirus KNV1]
MENSAGIPIVPPCSTVRANQVFDTKLLIAHGSPVIIPQGFQKTNPYVMITSDDETLSQYQGLLVHYNPPNGSYFTAAKSGLVASEFNHQEIIRKEILARASKLIGEYLKNMKYPPAEFWMQTMTRQDKKKMQIHRRKWPLVMAELLEVCKQLEDARNTQPDEEEWSDEESPDDLYDSEYLQEEEYIRKSIGPKSWWAKKYELMPRPHHQRLGKKAMSKELFDARHSHEKYQYYDKTYYDVLDNTLHREYVEHWEAHHPQYYSYQYYWDMMYDSDDDY